MVALVADPLRVTWRLPMSTPSNKDANLSSEQRWEALFPSDDDQSSPSPLNSAAAAEGRSSRASKENPVPTRASPPRSTISGAGRSRGSAGADQTAARTT